MAHAVNDWSSSDPGSGVKRETSIVIKVQLAQPKEPAHEPSSKTPEKPAAVAHRQSGKFSTQDGDIELVEFSPYPAVRDWRQSTEHLVPCSTSTSGFKDADQEAQRRQVPFDSLPRNLARAREIPDYKPTPLRSSFLAFLFMFIAGTFAFLEYQVHDLPPLRYSVMNLDMARRAKHNNVNHSQPSSQPTRTYNPANFVTITRQVPARRAMMVAAPRPEPDPDPDPRPPDNAYPSPAAPMSYCGWYAPQWFINSRSSTPTPCDQLPEDQPGHDLCPGNVTGDDAAPYYRQWDLQEYIQTFVTNDSSWCPCRTFMKTWGSSEIENELQYIHDWWVTDDEGCKSVMVAIESINYCKWGRIYTPATATTEVFQNDFSTYLTPPAQASSQIWPLPSIRAGTDVMLPMVIRAAGTEVMDVFGNKVEPAETATFPVNFYSRPPFGLGLAPTTLPCFLKSNMFFRFLEECTSLPVSGSMSVVWWQLPLSRPTLTSAVTTKTAPSTTSESTDVVATGPTIPTNTAQHGSSIQVPPVCTGCGTSSINSTDPGSSLGSEPPAQTAPATASSALAGFVTSAISLVQHSILNSTSLPSTRGQLEPGTDSEARFRTAEPDMPSVLTSSTTIPASRTSSTDLVLVPIGVPGTHGQPLPESLTVMSTTGRLSDQTTITSRSLSNPDSSPQIIANAVSSSLRFDAEQTFQLTGPQIQNSVNSMDSVTALLSLRPSPHPSPETTVSLPVRPFSRPPKHYNDNITTISDNSKSSSITRNSSDPQQQQQQQPPSSLTQAPPQLIRSINPASGAPTPTATTTTTTTGRQLTPLSNPGPQPPGPVSPEVQSSFSNLRSEASYLLASVIPVLLTTLLSIPIQVFSSSLNSFLPFRALTRHEEKCGAKAQDSILLSRNPSLLSSQVASVRFLARYRDPLPGVSMFLGVLALVLVPVSSEVIRLELTSDCDLEDFSYKHLSSTGAPDFLKVCAFGLRRSGGLIRVAEAILCVMAVLVLLLGVMLGRWRSGLGSPVLPVDVGKENGTEKGEPWSITHMAELLATCQELALLLRTVDSGEGTNVKREMKMALEGMRFRLGWFMRVSKTPNLVGNHNAHQARKMVYGLEIIHPALEDDKSPLRLTTRDARSRKATTVRTSKTGVRLRSWFTRIPNEVSLRILALLFTVGLLGLILVYENTIAPDTAFERFMDSQSFGVRILFTVFGTVISLFWGCYFSQTSETQIHRHLSLSAQQPHDRAGLPPQQSIYLSPPSDVFVGVYRSVFHTQDLHSFNIALAALLAKFMPILLSNIPFYNTVTFNIHEACTWMAVVVLGYMILVLGGGLMISCGWSFKGIVSSLAGRLRGVLGWNNNNINMRNRGGVLDRASGTCPRERKPADLPVKVDNMAGCMYYVCDSSMLRDLEQTQAEKLVGDDIKVNHRSVASFKEEKRYVLGEIVGVVSGDKRVGVDYVHGISRS